MLAPAQLPQDFASWNEEHLAPYGPPWWDRVIGSRFSRRLGLSKHRMRLPFWLMRRIGPFAFQENSWNRAFEYPWCFAVAEMRPGMKVVDVGGGASGFQFALANAGMEVTSVDPLLTPAGVKDWTFTERHFDRLNSAFGGKVRFIRDFLQNAELPSDSVDRVFSISVIEHIPIEEISPLVREIQRILRPGGRFVATVDLFLDCAPFTDRPRNKFGSNISISTLVEASELEMVAGKRDQLCGFDEFRPQDILRHAEDHLNIQDVMTQCFVLEKN